jgi:hypothetical protein
MRAMAIVIPVLGGSHLHRVLKFVRHLEVDALVYILRDDHPSRVLKLLLLCGVVVIAVDLKREAPE